MLLILSLRRSHPAATPPINSCALLTILNYFSHPSLPPLTLQLLPHHLWSGSILVVALRLPCVNHVQLFDCSSGERKLKGSNLIIKLSLPSRGPGHVLRYWPVEGEPLDANEHPDALAAALAPIADLDHQQQGQALGQAAGTDFFEAES